MNDWAKMITTFIIWGALAGVLIGTADSARDINVLALILGIAASISTAAIWAGSRQQQMGAAIEQQSMKAKRNARMTRLVDHLDDDEVYQLEELLAARREEPYREQSS